MRQLIYAAVSLVLVGVFVGAGTLWFRSHEYSEQAAVRVDVVTAWREWWDGAQRAERDADARSGDAGNGAISVWTSDRGQLGFLWLEVPAGDGFTGREDGEIGKVGGWSRRAVVWDWRVNQASEQSTPRLDELCAERGLGFGWDREVAVSGLERPMVARMFGEFVPGGGGSWWALRRVVVPLWVIMATAGGLWLVWTMTFGLRTHRISKGACTRCGHDVTQSSHYCPQCRKPIPRRTWSGETRPRRAGKVALEAGAMRRRQ